MATDIPEFRVLRFSPGPRTELLTYLSMGASTIEHAGAGLYEFFLLAASPDDRQKEIVTMVSWYQRKRPLGIGHTLPIGEPWLPGSRCDHLLVSTPYPFGPNLEICEMEGLHAHISWILPITRAERDFKAAQGLETLESLFESNALHFWDAHRKSLV